MVTNSVFILRWRWSDIPGSEAVDLCPNIETAEEERKRLVADQQRSIGVDPSSAGKLEIRIERYNFDCEIEKVIA